MPYFSSSTRPHQQTKVTPLGGDETQTSFALRRISGQLIPTRLTPAPSESVIRTHVNVPEFGSEEFYAFVRAENARLNGEA